MKSQWCIHWLFIIYWTLSVNAASKKLERRYGKHGHFKVKSSSDFDFAQDVRLLESSGDDGEDFGDDDDFSGDRGSGDEPISKPIEPPFGMRPDTACLRHLHELEYNRMPGAFVPRCTKNGEYEVLQCHGSKCYCANKLGQEIPGTAKYPPHMPDCSQINRDAAVLAHPTTPSRYYPEYMTTVRPEYPWNDPHPTYNPGYHGDDHAYVDKRRRMPELLIRPGLLAGIISGAMIALLCAILLIMFVVYRLRQNRDYADEKSNKVPIIGYANGHDRDLYA